MPLNKSWHDYNKSLIEHGRVLIDVSFLKSSNKEIKNMNIRMVEAPFQYSDSYVQFLAKVHFFLISLPQRKSLSFFETAQMYCYNFPRRVGYKPYHLIS